MQKSRKIKQNVWAYDIFKMQAVWLKGLNNNTDDNIAFKLIFDKFIINKSLLVSKFTTFYDVDI